MKYLMVLGLGICFAASTTWAQSSQDILPGTAHIGRYQSDPLYRTLSDEVDAWLYRQASQGIAPAQSRGVLQIPLVIHIMHLPQDSVPGVRSSNPSDAQVQQGLEWINDAFRNRGSYAGGPFYTNANIPSVDTEIEFCLAGTNPAGSATNGINRISTGYSNLYRDAACGNGTQDDCLKDLSRWDPTQYLNVWLVNNICKLDDNSTCGIKGYAYMAGAHGSKFDGLVMESSSWGMTTEEQVMAIAELGRYLNLFNTWNAEEGEECVNQNCLNDGDKVCDTPPDNFPGAVLCALGSRMNSCNADIADTTTNNPFTTDVEDMYENYMDGGEPGCRNTFTPGQKIRMRAVLLSQRASLLQSKGCEVPTTDLSIKGLSAPSTITCMPRPRPRLLLKNEGTLPINSFEIRWELDDISKPSYSWEGTLNRGDSIELVLDQLLLSPGTHQMICHLVEINGVSTDDIPGNNLRNWSFVYVPTTTSISQFPYCTDLESGQMSNSWLQGNMDNKVQFDIMQEERCTEAAGDYVIRYNTMGAHVNENIDAAVTGTRDLLISPRLDLTPYAQAWLHFDVAYGGAPQGKQLGLQIQAVSSCQGEFETVYEKSGDSLATVPSNTPFNLIPWKPIDCGEWRHESINLSDYTGTELMLVFNTILESAFSQNLYLDNICVEVSFDPPCIAPDRIPETVGTYTADAYCTDLAGWTHYYKQANTRPATPFDVQLFSAKLGPDPTAILPAEGVQVILTDAYGKQGHDLSPAPYVSNPTGWHVAGRYYQLTPLAQPDDSVEIQFYFSEQDIRDMEQAIAPGQLASTFDVMPYQIRMAADASPNSGHAGVEASQYHEWRVGEIADAFHWAPDMTDHFYSAKMLSDGLWAGGLGTGGEGEAYGATYPAPLSELRLRQINESEVRLGWTTPREWQSLAFSVYRSADRDSFEQIGTLDAIGESMVATDYAFIDPHPYPELNYYFVALEHENGFQVVSDTFRLRLEQGWLVQVYPNPVIRNISVDLNAEPLQAVEFGVYDSNWRLLYEANWIQQEGQIKELSLNELPTGLYFYAVKLDGVPIRVGKLMRGIE